jgi:hypothetical protein
MAVSAYLAEQGMTVEYGMGGVPGNPSQELVTANAG